jgi:dihydroorotase-like cyclic amidohydrolase
MFEFSFCNKTQINITIFNSGICQTEDELGSLIEPLIEPMAISYLDIFEKASKNMREFYGLRDFYR